VVKKSVKKTVSGKKTTTKRKIGGGFLDVIKRSTATISEPVQSVSSAMYAAYPTADARQEFLQSLPTGPHPVSQSKPDALSSSMKLAEDMQHYYSPFESVLHRRKLSFITQKQNLCSAVKVPGLSGKLVIFKRISSSRNCSLCFK
jgi:hypothetical protein